MLRPDHFTPGIETRPLYRRLGGPQGQSGRVRNIAPSPEFELRTIQLVTSRYTDHAIAATTRIGQKINANKVLGEKREGKGPLGPLGMDRRIPLKRILKIEDERAWTLFDSG